MPDDSPTSYEVTFTSTFTLSPAEIWPDGIPLRHRPADVLKEITDEIRYCKGYPEFLRAWNLGDYPEIHVEGLGTPPGPDVMDSTADRELRANYNTGGAPNYVTERAPTEEDNEAQCSTCNDTMCMRCFHGVPHSPCEYDCPTCSPWSSVAPGDPEPDPSAAPAEQVPTIEEEM